MLPTDSVKWDIDAQNKTITLDNVVMDITTKDYIGQNLSEYAEKTPVLLGFSRLVFGFLFWISMILLLGIACDKGLDIEGAYLMYPVFFTFVGIFYFLRSYIQGNIDKYNDQARKEFYDSGRYRKEYFENRLKPNLLYKYLKKRIPNYAAMSDEHQLIESENFSSTNMDVLMSKVYLDAFLLNATGIIINQNNISNEVSGYVSGHISGYTSSTGIGSVSGHTHGETHTETTHHCHVSFVR